MNFKTYKAYVKNKQKQERILTIQAESLTEVKEFLRKKFDSTNIDEVKFINKSGKTIASLNVKEFDLVIL